MNTDIRLSVDFWDHKKTFRLERQLGIEGVAALVRLWCWAGKHAPDGFLNDMDAIDIAMAAKWTGDPQVFIDALMGKWIDNGSILKLHDWEDHQPWAVGSKEREEAARIAGKASAEARKQKYGTSQPLNASRTDRSQAPERFPNGSRTDLRTPSPSPLPKPTPKDVKKKNTDFVLPEWVPLETWEEFKLHRKTIKAPMSIGAEKGMIAELMKLKNKGYDPGEMLALAMASGWRKVFEPREANNGTKPTNQPTPTREQEDKYAGITKTINNSGV
jgi:hypothetical protein